MATKIVEFRRLPPKVAVVEPTFYQCQDEQDAVHVAFITQHITEKHPGYNALIVEDPKAEWTEENEKTVYPAGVPEQNLENS